MNNYATMLKAYFKESHNLISYNSLNNKIRLFNGLIFKTFSNLDKYRRHMTAITLLKETSIDFPDCKFASRDDLTVIESYISGIALNEFRNHLSENNLYEIGKILGQLHSLRLEKIKSDDFWTSNILSKLKKIQPKLLSVQPNLSDAFITVGQNCKTLFKDLNLSYIHGNFNISNIILNTVNNKFYLVDFENFSIGDPAFDIFEMLKDLKFTNNYSIKHVSAFLSGYSSEKELPKDLVIKWQFYDIFTSLLFIYQELFDDSFKTQDPDFIDNCYKSVYGLNTDSLLMANWLNELNSQ